MRYTKRKKLTLQERAARASERLCNRGSGWDNAHDGYLAGYRAAKLEARAELKALKAQRAVLFEQAKTLREIATYEADRRIKLQDSVRRWGQQSISETRPEPQYFNHPLKRI